MLQCCCSDISQNGGNVKEVFKRWAMAIPAAPLMPHDLGLSACRTPTPACIDPGGMLVCHPKNSSTRAQGMRLQCMQWYCPRMCGCNAVTERFWFC